MESPTQRSYGPVAMTMLLAVVALTVVVRAQSPEPKSAYQLWLTQDVVYIIAPEEKAAFESLRSDPERERFIEQFWLRRDPTPGTVENEAKEEHYRRIGYSNERFPSRTRAGWATARGRVYIVHGPPDEIESHPTPKRELWLYHKGMKFEFRGDEYELTSQTSASAGVLADIDLIDVPEPVRGQLAKELSAFKGQPMSNALMDQIRAVQRRIAPELGARWGIDQTTRATSLKLFPPNFK